jgi:uncharacterized repeat protein (TIGR01451 family)
MHKADAQAKEPVARAKSRRLASLLRQAATGLQVCVCLVVAGCQFPAIDQSGQRIFSGGGTSLAHHDGGLFHRRDPVPMPAAGVPTVVVPGPPAVVAPAAPPCNPPVVVGPLVQQPPVIAVPVVPIQPVACGPAGRIEQTPLPPKLQIAGPVCENGAQAAAGPVLTITPSRLVAPVGSEVALVAGICDGRGYYVLRQPLEWMLAQDGVGQIMCVGRESPLGASYVLRHSPQKVATNYVRAHTSTIEQTVDRGNGNRADDIYLQRGQSYITVSSPTEGTSHVTVWAPKENNWDRRQTTATIYWVDARWQLPAPASARAGQKQLLETVVTRSGGAPVAGWIVRYEVLEGPEANLSVRGDKVLEVKTDGAGRAAVELLPRTMEPGITTVGVQVIRPASGRGDLPQMVVGQGTAAVSWSTPGLSVSALGPSSVSADGTVSYRVEVVNNGDLPTTGVVVNYTPPTGVTLLNSSPPAQVFGQRYQWRIGDLAPRTASTIEVNCRAAVAADIHSVFRANSANEMSAEGRATTRVFANALSVKMTGPDSVEVGREAKFLIDITNTGSTPLTGVVASDSFDPGLEHVGGGQSPIRKALPKSLEPGQTEKIAIAFLVTRAGRHAHRLDVTAEGGHSAGARSVVTGIAAAAPAATPPKLEVSVTGPKTERVGEVAEYFIEVANRGTQVAKGVVIDVQFGSDFEFDRASGAGRTDDLPRRRTQWRVGDIAGGQTIRKQLNLRCAKADGAASAVQASASAENFPAGQAAAASTRITGGEPAVRPTPMNPTSPVTPPVTPPAMGELTLTVGDLSDPIMLGGKTTIAIVVKNGRTVADENVTVSVQVDAGLKVAGGTGPTGISGISADGLTVEFTPVTEIGPGETLAAFRIDATGTKAGKQAVRVTVKSKLTPAGVTATSETTVNMP